MAAISSVPAVKAAIFDLLKARAALGDGAANGLVYWGHPHPHEPYEAVWMGDAEFESETAQIRATPRAHLETYTIPIIVKVVMQGNRPQETEERTWTIVGEVEQAFRADPVPGSVTGLLSAVVTGKFFNSVGAPWRGCEAIVFVRVQARTEP